MAEHPIDPFAEPLLEKFRTVAIQQRNIHSCAQKEDQRTCSIALQSLHVESTIGVDVATGCMDQQGISNAAIYS